MLKLVSGLLVASVLVGVVGCGGGSSSSTPGSSASNKEIRSLTSGTGIWNSETNESATCIEKWSFPDGYTIESLNLRASGAFAFTEEVISGERHLLVFTEVTPGEAQACTNSYYDDLPVNNSYYLDFITDDQFDIYTASSGGNSLGRFDR